MLKEVLFARGVLVRNNTKVAMLKTGLEYDAFRVHSQNSLQSKTYVIFIAINGLNGANTQAGAMNRHKATGSVNKNIQNQITNAQKALQELSSNDEMTTQEKMKKRQEIQKQEI